MVIPLYALLVLRDLGLGAIAFGGNAARAGTRLGPGGIIADTIGIRPTLWIAVIGMLSAATVMALSPGRKAANSHP